MSFESPSAGGSPDAQAFAELAEQFGEVSSESLQKLRWSELTSKFVRQWFDADILSHVFELVPEAAAGPARREFALTRFGKRRNGVSTEQLGVRISEPHPSGSRYYPPVTVGSAWVVRTYLDGRQPRQTLNGFTMPQADLLAAQAQELLDAKSSGALQDLSYDFSLPPKCL